MSSSGSCPVGEGAGYVPEVPDQEVPDQLTVESPVERKKKANSSSTTAAPAAGTSQMPRQSCPEGLTNASTTSPDTHDPMNMPTPSVTKAINPCAAARRSAGARRST